MLARQLLARGAGLLLVACHASDTATRTPKSPAPASPPEIVKSVTEDRPSEESALRRRYADQPALKSLSGEASWYSDALAGRATASGEAYDPTRFTAAHPSLPFGTILRVRALNAPTWVYVRVNDRGPKAPRGRILDLSRSAADRIGLRRAGVLDVRAEVVEYGPARKRGGRGRRQ